jgi:hypothetical protein
MAGEQGQWLPRANATLTRIRAYSTASKRRLTYRCSRCFVVMDAIYLGIAAAFFLLTIACVRHVFPGFQP